MTDDHKHVKGIVTAYCVLVLASFLLLTGVLVVSAFARTSLPRMVGQIAAFAPAVLLVVGILLQLTIARIHRTKDIGICIVLTGVWSVILGVALLYSF